jgi:hypothetical protein
MCCAVSGGGYAVGAALLLVLLLTTAAPAPGAVQMSWDVRERLMDAALVREQSGLLVVGCAVHSWSCGK